ncbi:MAG: type II toxin-antitoxin system VapC family toxin [Actinomycetota bacterium]
MKLVDANVLLYAVNEDAEHHATARGWVDEALSGGATVGFAWVPLLAFLRLSTRHGLFPRPLALHDALAAVDDWLTAPAAEIVHPTPRHPLVLRRLLEAVGPGANLVNDAHLAALALEHHAEVVSYDNDFARFPGVVWERPRT